MCISVHYGKDDIHNYTLLYNVMFDVCNELQMLLPTRHRRSLTILTFLCNCHLKKMTDEPQYNAMNGLGDMCRLFFGMPLYDVASVLRGVKKGLRTSCDCFMSRLRMSHVVKRFAFVYV